MSSLNHSKAPASQLDRTCLMVSYLLNLESVVDSHPSPSPIAHWGPNPFISEMPTPCVHQLDRDLQALIRLSRSQLARLERQENGRQQQRETDLIYNDDYEDGLLWDLMQRTNEVTSLVEDLRPSP